MASAVVENHLTSDGRRFIRERHTFADGYAEDVVYVAPGNVDVNAELAIHAQQVARNRAEAEFRRVVVHIAAGRSLQSFAFSATTIQHAAKRLLKLLAEADNPRRFRSYAALVNGAPSATVANLLGVDSTKAGRIKTWARSVVDSIDAQDSSKASVADIIMEAGV